MALRIGDLAPSFDLTASDGRKVRSEDLRGKKNIVLYFYPADFTTVCTAEACGFRDMYEDLMSQDTEVIGVSVDNDAKHQAFAHKHQVPFPLIADVERSLARKYDAAGGLTALVGRTQRITYVIDKSGRIAAVFDSAIFAKKHLEGVREALRRLGAGVGAA